MSIVDAHLHFWRLARGDYAWLTPENTALYRDFSPADIAPALKAHGVQSAVAVQAAATEAETRFLFEIAREHPVVAGVVGWTDFEAPDAAERIAALHEQGRGLLKGFRPMVQDIADADWLARPALDPAFDALVALDLSFDALVRPAHLPALLARLRRSPELRVVIDHGGKPDIGGSGFGAWAGQIAQLARQAGTVCKLSGLLTEAQEDATLADLQPYAAHLFDSFGPCRMMWGSDWPVVTLRADYAVWLASAKALVGRYARGYEDEVFSQTARRCYRLWQRALPKPTQGTNA
ncbi:amidohydrolase family protein [Luteimonas aquatica]|uniref:amidohydrolase family protein n=1 Tax=Luteimonas aquatica TaxID=450364 RepID=UPI001F597B2D|nr:amidohydrolase family protein [Luteimonas aquatica]